MRRPSLSTSLRALAAACVLTSAAPAAAYNLLGIYWDTREGPVRFALEPSGSEDVTDGSDLDALRDAFHNWACIEGSSLRFLEDDRAGTKTLDPDDGLNTLFWDEDGSYAMLLGPSTLGVTVGNAPQEPGQFVVREGADIVFNGNEHTWDTTGPGGGVDVGSVAIHEIGHLLGLGHPCTDQAETDCLGPDQAVMTPQLPEGAVIRDPFTDDINGLLEVYPQDADDPSTCEGPFRVGEPCACNDECVPGLVCTEVEDGVPTCLPDCGSDPLSCPNGYVCVLAAPADGSDVSRGACVARSEDNRVPPAAPCERDSECQQGGCFAVPLLGARVCEVRCDADGDCPDDYACTDSVCTAAGATEGLVCPDTGGEEPTCACAQPGREVPTAWAFALIGWLGLRLSRSRFRHFRRT